MTFTWIITGASRGFGRAIIRELTLSLAATEYKIATYGGTTGDE